MTCIKQIPAQEMCGKAQNTLRLAHNRVTVLEGPLSGCYCACELWRVTFCATNAEASAITFHDGRSPRLRRHT